MINLLLTVLLPLSVLSFSFRNTYRAQAQAGLTLSPCNSTSSICQGERKCQYLQGPLDLADCNTNRTDCFCFGDQKSCNNSSECPTGEFCADVPTVPDPFCISALAFEYQSSFQIVGERPDIKYGGLTLDPCRKNNDCNDSRFCQEFVENEPEKPCQDDSDRCYCFPGTPTFCTEDKMDVCQQGETCVVAPQEEIVCASETALLYSPLLSKPKMPTSATMPLKGVTYEPCNNDGDCVEDRFCKALQDEKWPDDWPKCEGQGQCFCFPEILRTCRNSTQCIEREVCAGAKGIEGTYCISAVISAVSPDITAVDTKPFQGEGLTLYPCSNTDGCKGSRTCVYDGGENQLPCEDGKSCFCFAYQPCKQDNDCELGELCIHTGEDVSFCASAAAAAAFDSVDHVTPTPTSTVDPTPSYSPSATGSSTPTKTATPSPSGSAASSASPSPSVSTSVSASPSSSSSPSDSTPATSSPSPTGAEGVCVDAELLTHLSGEQLVFERHVWASVLCDRKGSCATPGHMVVYRGKAMMMRRYCDIVKCTRESKLVNSPRYGVAVRVRSRTDGLLFTAFAARYETGLEEGLLRMAVHVGL